MIIIDNFTRNIHMEDVHDNVPKYVTACSILSKDIITYYNKKKYVLKHHNIIYYITHIILIILLK